MDEDTELENNSELTETENTGTDNDSGTGEENSSDSGNTETDIPESGNNTEGENPEPKKVYFSWNKSFNAETKSPPRRLPESVISDSIDQQKAAIANALGDIGISGVGGGGSDIDFNELKEEIITEVIERLRPSGHVYPDTSLYPEYIRPIISEYDNGARNPTDYIPREPDGDVKYALEYLDVSKFQNLSHMFDDYYNSSFSRNFAMTNPSVFANLDLSNWNVSNVKNMFKMFANNSFIKSLNLSGWDVRKVTNMNHMFRGYNSGSPFSLIENLNVSNWDVRNIVSMQDMFRYQRYLTELDLSTWDLSYVQYMGDMFHYCLGLTKLLWGGAVNSLPDKLNDSPTNVSLDLGSTILTPENAGLFFQSLSPKTTSNEVIIQMPSSAQGADISIATAKGYTIAGITQPS